MNLSEIQKRFCADCKTPVMFQSSFSLRSTTGCQQRSN